MATESDPYPDLRVFIFEQAIYTLIFLHYFHGRSRSYRCEQEQY